MALSSSLPVIATEHAIKTLLFLIEAAQGETNAGGVPLELDPPGADVDVDESTEQQAAEGMVVDEETTREGQQ
jgi:hypothetical protein